MPDPTQPADPATASLAERINRWVLTRTNENVTRGHAHSSLIIALLLAAIGMIDYFAGVRVSLALFYVVPVTLSVAWLGWRAGCLTGLLSVLIRVGGDLAAGGYNAGALTVFWNRLIDLAMYWVLAGILHALITLQRQLEERVRERTEALARALQDREDMQRQLYAISREERASIGRELHDGLGQHLTAASLAAKLLGNRLEGEAHPAAGEAQALLRLLQEGIAQTRQIARGLLLSSIEPGELAGELEELCNNLQREQSVPCLLVREGDVTGLDVSQSSHLYYIAQEAARNALRHGRPSQIEILLRCSPGAVELTITDNGRGLPAPDSPRSGMGLRIMAHRAELIGANFAIDPAPGGRGLRIRCVLPLAAAVTTA